MSDSGDDKTVARREGGSGRSGAESTRLAAALVAGGLIAVFALLNTDEVEVNWILGTAQTPLILVVVVSLLFGALAGYLVARRGSRARRKRD